MLTPAARFVLLFVLLYAAFGTASPFLPSLVQSRGVSAEAIGLLFGAGTAIRLLSAPIAAQIADRRHAIRTTFATCALGSALVVTAYSSATTFATLLAVTLLHSIALAPTTNLADALAVIAARRDGFEYGWVRGAGSAAFIAASLVAGSAIGHFGIDIVIPLQAGLMLAAGLAVFGVPSVDGSLSAAPISRADVLDLLRIRAFQRVVLVAALVLGSHALHDTFSVIRWRAAGISPQAISLLWSLAVAGEVVVFLLLGPWLLQRIAPVQAIGLAAIAGAGRWIVAAWTTDPLILMLIQPLHGITFALLHLAAMRILALTVPNSLAATAQAVYGTLGVGIASALTTILSGWLYSRLDGAAFLVMSAMCLAALPVAWSLRTKRRHH